MKRHCLLLCTLAALASASLVHAHGLWVGSNHYLLEYPGKTPGPLKATLYTGWGHRLPIDEPVATDRFGGIQLIAPDGKSQTVNSGADGFHAGTVEMAKAGVWLAHSANKPGFSTQIKGDDGALSYLPLPKNEIPAGKKIVETNYIRTFGKTVIYVKGAGANEDILSKPIGHDLEIVPLRNPGTTSAGDTFPVQVLFKGKPYVSEPVELVAEHVASPYVGKPGKWIGETDAQGKVNVPVGLSGMWVLLVTVFDSAEGELAAKADQTRLRATLTFEIPGAPSSGH